MVIPETFNFTPFSSPFLSLYLSVTSFPIILVKSSESNLLAMFNGIATSFYFGFGIIPYAILSFDIIVGIFIGILTFLLSYSIFKSLKEY